VTRRQVQLAIGFDEQAVLDRPGRGRREERVLSRRLGKQLIPMRMVGRSTSTGRSRGSITSLSEKPAW